MTDKTANSINFYGNVSGSQIQQGSNNQMHFTNNIAVNEEKLQLFVEQLQQYKTLFPQEFGEKSGILVKALDDVQIALNTKNKTLLGESTKIIKDVATGAAGSILASGILASLSALNL